MALLMEKGAEPQTESELADLDAISALKESAALELKEEGNKYVKMGKKHYSEAINCYTRAINQKALSDMETSMIFSNRAHVNLQLGNYGRALSDSEEAIKLSPTNVKAFYRAAKASLSLNKLVEARSFCVKGLDENPDNVDLKKLCEVIDSQISQRQQHEAQVSKALTAAKDLVSAIEERGLKIGKAMFQELTGLKKPILDKDRILHWPVLLLYAEIVVHHCHGIRRMLTLVMPLSCTMRRDQDAVKPSPSVGGEGGSKWVKVNERRTLHSVLKEDKFVIPGIPVFFAVSKRSKSFYKKFKSGNWSLPS
ncbi:unnamed protein product [Lactuca virosa]|uniref:Uncharacterized protein n=1 Tax=Lactuca virosa TaxID=75947 RepID=A0AAU9PB11_9ASTR|nr:unnamed protein product [Lactuca virosa]